MKITTTNSRALNFKPLQSASVAKVVSNVEVAIDPKKIPKRTLNIINNQLREGIFSHASSRLAPTLCRLYAQVKGTPYLSIYIHNGDIRNVNTKRGMDVNIIFRMPFFLEQEKAIPTYKKMQEAMRENCNAFIQIGNICPHVPEVHSFGLNLVMSRSEDDPRGTHRLKFLLQGYWERVGYDYSKADFAELYGRTIILSDKEARIE